MFMSETIFRLTCVGGTVPVTETKGMLHHKDLGDSWALDLQDSSDKHLVQ